jgi:hypothetical protein
LGTTLSSHRQVKDEKVEPVFLHENYKPRLYQDLNELQEFKFCGNMWCFHRVFRSQLKKPNRKAMQQARVIVQQEHSGKFNCPKYHEEAKTHLELLTKKGGQIHPAFELLEKLTCLIM